MKTMIFYGWFFRTRSLLGTCYEKGARMDIIYVIFVGE